MHTVDQGQFCGTLLQTLRVVMRGLLPITLRLSLCSLCYKILGGNLRSHALIIAWPGKGYNGYHPEARVLSR